MNERNTITVLVGISNSGKSTDAMKGIRQVDPRTIQYLIINKVKYNLKKK